MAGPNSSPCGDKTLVDNTQIHCAPCKGWFRKRDHLAKHGKLRTGKTK